MANHRDIIDIFDECIDRLAAGEDIEAILVDFPAEAQSLRGMLETGLLVYQIQNDTPGVDEARSRGRGKLEEAMSELESEQDKPKRKPRPIQWVVFAAAAVFALMLGIGIGIGNGMRPAQYGNVAMNMSEVPPESDMMLTATQIIAEVSATAFVAMGGATSTPTPVSMALESTSLPPTIVPPGLDSFALTATQFVKEITQTVEVQMTLTTVALGIGSAPTQPPTATSTTTVTATPTALPTQTAVPTLGAVTTSVASMDRMTATPLPADLREVGASAVTPVAQSLNTPMPTPTDRDLGGGDGDGSFGIASTPTPASLASVPGRPDLVMTSTASYVAVTPAPESGRDVAEAEEPLAPPAVIDSTTTGTTVLPIQPTIVPDFSQVQLQPLKAGEIDDNADWDTYTLYRRNFLEMYGGLIIDVDITGRQIIKIVDKFGRPVLGARVEVFYGTQPVSSTLTYATGMTLFFPNAKPEFSRMDTFRVVVTKNDILSETTLNTERIDDILTITLGN